MATMRILLIDDEQDYRDHVQHILDGLGGDKIELDYVAGGEDALRLVQSEPKWDLYLIDWRFVGCMFTGHDIIETLLGTHADAEVVLSTQYETLRLEPELVDRISNGRVVLLEKMRHEKQYFEKLLAPGRKQPLHVLVLEDDPEDAELVSNALRIHSDSRIRPEIVRSMRHAREKIQEIDVHGLVLDYHLHSAGEVGTGIDFYKSLDEHLRQLPAVLFTGATSLDLDAGTLQLIARGHLRFMSKANLDGDRLVACFER